MCAYITHIALIKGDVLKEKGYIIPAYFRNKKCGSKERLTKHHLFPQCYSKHLNGNYLEHMFEKVELLCIDCHRVYEDHAWTVKQDLLLHLGYNFEPRYVVDQELKRIYDMATVFCKRTSSNDMKQYARRFFTKMLGLMDHEISKKRVRMFKGIQYRYDNRNFVPMGEFVKDKIKVKPFIDFWYNDYYNWLHA